MLPLQGVSLDLSYMALRSSQYALHVIPVLLMIAAMLLKLSTLWVILFLYILFKIELVLVNFLRNRPILVKMFHSCHALSIISQRSTLKIQVFLLGLRCLLSNWSVKHFLWRNDGNLFNLVLLETSSKSKVTPCMFKTQTQYLVKLSTLNSLIVHMTLLINLSLTPVRMIDPRQL